MISDMEKCHWVLHDWNVTMYYKSSQVKTQFIRLLPIIEQKKMKYVAYVAMAPIKQVLPPEHNIMPVGKFTLKKQTFIFSSA